MRYLLALVALTSCAGFGDADEKALVAAQMNAELTKAQAADFRAYILAADARQRAGLERELALVVEIEVRAESQPTADTFLSVMRQAAAKRAELYAQLDREREAWINDPKLRQQERIADMLTAYASARSEFARFVKETINVGSK